MRKGARVGTGADMSLEVQIEKKLPEFTLDVTFTAGSAPLSILGPFGRGQDDVAAVHRGPRAPP